MRLPFIAAFAACLSFVAPPAWAQTSPDPGVRSPDPGVSSMQVLGYARSLEGQIAQLERRVKGMPSSISKDQLTAAITALREEIKPLLDAKANQADLDALTGRVAVVETALTEGVPVWYVDGDGDGYGALEGGLKAALTKPAGYSDKGGDCNDGNAGVNPNIAEAFNNGVNDDCDANTPDKLPAQPARLVGFQLGVGYRFFIVPGPVDAGFDRRELHLGVVRGSVTFDLARHSETAISLVRINGEGGGGSSKSFTAGLGVDWCGGRNWTGASVAFCGGASYRRSDARADRFDHPSWSSSAIAVTLAPRVDVGRWWLEVDIEPGVGQLKAWGADDSTRSGWGFTLGSGLVTGARF